MYNHQLMCDARDAKGLSNRDIANQKSLSEPTVSRYMSGLAKEGRIDILSDICDVLDLSLDKVLNRETIIELSSSVSDNLTENLVIIQNIEKNNYDRIRTIEREKDAAFNRHIDHLKEQLDEKAAASSSHIDHLKEQLAKYSRQFTRYNNTIIALVCLCGLLLGMMITMFINNRALQSQVKDLQDNLAEYHHEYMADDAFPTE